MQLVGGSTESESFFSKRVFSGERTRDSSVPEPLKFFSGYLTNLVMDITRRSALFWDYENVPLRKKDRGRFLWAIVNMLNTFTVDFRRIYARRATMSTYDYKQLLAKGFDKHKHFKWIEVDEPNAVDFSLIRSCIDVMGKLPEVTQIVLISGDGDFLPLVTQFPDHYIVVICQQQNLNRTLIQTVNRAYSVEAIITKTRKWFYV